MSARRPGCDEVKVTEPSNALLTSSSVLESMSYLTKRADKCP